MSQKELKNESFKFWSWMLFFLSTTLILIIFVGKKNASNSLGLSQTRDLGVGFDICKPVPEIDQRHLTRSPELTGLVVYFKFVEVSPGSYASFK